MGFDPTFFKCPICQTRVMRAKFSGDISHRCNSGNLALDQEDKVVISTTVSEYGNPVESTGRLKGDILYQGIANKVFGQDAGLAGLDVNNRTRRGNRAPTRRQRHRFVYIDIR